jgi:membrane protease subunit (stomatin/prohibitin family)
MSKVHGQSTLFRGIYEFEDPSGSIIAAKVPATGTLDLFNGTMVLVKPNQCAVFVYKGQVADILFAGNHELKTENIPILTNLANWKLGFQNPLRCELFFIANHQLSSRRWGSPQGILTMIEGIGQIQLKAHGYFNLRVIDGQKFFLSLMGTSSVISITDVEELVQGMIIESLPEVFSTIRKLEDIGKMYPSFAIKIESQVNKELRKVGMEVTAIKILSALPNKEVLDAIDARAAINTIGSQREYILYKAANSLTSDRDTPANDPMQLMLGMMLGKGLLNPEETAQAEKIAIEAKIFCQNCGTKANAHARFCEQCGKKML